MSDDFWERSLQNKGIANGKDGSRCHWRGPGDDGGVPILVTARPYASIFEKPRTPDRLDQPYNAGYINGQFTVFTGGGQRQSGAGPGDAVRPRRAAMRRLDGEACPAVQGHARGAGAADG